MKALASVSSGSDVPTSMPALSWPVFKASAFGKKKYNRDTYYGDSSRLPGKVCGSSSMRGCHFFKYACPLNTFVPLCRQQDGLL